jgi:hypothetical protein
MLLVVGCWLVTNTDRCICIIIGYYWLSVAECCADITRLGGSTFTSLKESGVV